MSKREHDELLDLAASACDGPLEAERQHRLDCLLASSPEARKVWLSFAELHTELALHTRADAILDRSLTELVTQVSSPLDAVLSQDESAEPAASATCCDLLEGDSESRLDEKRRTKSIAWLAGLAGISACVIAAVQMPGPRESDRVAKSMPKTTGEQSQPLLDASSSAPEGLLAERQPCPVATVHLNKAGEPNADLMPKEEGRLLFEGDRFDIEQGEAKLCMASGASILLTAPASLILTNANQVHLDRGELTAKLPEWATGFVVETKAMRVVDLGTTLYVSAESRDVSEARVLEGTITVRPREGAGDASGSVVLNEGESIRVTGNRFEREHGIPATTNEEQSVEKLDRTLPFKPIDIPGTGQRLLVGDEDPNWRITHVPEGVPVTTPRYAVVCREDPRYALSEPDKSAWISLDSGCSCVEAAAVYTFQTSFDLSDYEIESVRLQCQILADNGVQAIRVNGTPIEFDPWVDNSQHQRFDRTEFRAIDINESLVAGKNIVEIDVWNGGESGDRKLHLIPNPTALRVEWHAFGRPVR